MLRSLAVTVTMLALVAACGGGEEAGPGEKDTTMRSATATTTPSAPSLVGRWEQVHSCEQLVRALRKEGLANIAPAMVGDYFPNEKPERLAKKKDVCEGAKPEPHSHFFTDDGAFGSVDEDGNQVDDAPYAIVNNHVFRIGKGEFQYRIVDGDRLMLKPVIPVKERRRALAKPLTFSPAGWQVAVSYEGLPWKRVDCAGWC